MALKRVILINIFCVRDKCIRLDVLSSRRRFLFIHKSDEGIRMHSFFLSTRNSNVRGKMADRLNKYQFTFAYLQQPVAFYHSLPFAFLYANSVWSKNITKQVLKQLNLQHYMVSIKYT